MRCAVGLNYYIGSTLDRVEHALLSSPLFPITRYYSRGRVWQYDLARISGTRSLQTIFDVGANKGNIATQIYKYFPSAEFHCFEPGASAFSILESKFAANPHFNLNNLGVGSSEGELELSAHPNDQLATFHNTQEIWGDCPQEVVSLTTLDAYCLQRGIGKIDLLKVDVEGWELEVIAGASDLFARGAIRFLYIETGLMGKTEIHVPMEELHPKILEAGFSFSGLYEMYRQGEKKEQVVFGNALYVNTNWSE